LNAVAQVELLHHMGEVRFHGRLTQEQLLRDLRVGEAAGDEAKHLELATGELGNGRRQAAWWRTTAEIRDQTADERGREQRVAVATVRIAWTS
jgi:hypothetical protein